MSEITNAEAIAAWSKAPQQIVEQFGDAGDFSRQYLLNPVLFRLMGDVQGKRILDAGCGQGYLSRLLAQKGAIVTGIEPAEYWYNEAVSRETSSPLGINYLQCDLCDLDDMQNSFDCVIANMVFMDIPDYQTAISNCIATLKPSGSFIFSLLHPCFEETSASWPEKGYVEVREYLHEHVKPQSYAPLFHRPLSTYLNFVIQQGCILQEIVEPQLSPELAAPGTPVERSLHVPCFIVIHAIKH